MHFLEQGILSTEKGQRALLSFDSYERSLIQVSAVLFGGEFLYYINFVNLFFSLCWIKDIKINLV